MVNTKKERGAETRTRGDTVRAVQFTGRRVALSARLTSTFGLEDHRGFSLIELVITITVMTILTLGVIPLIKVSVKRQKEQQLHDALRQMRLAIDDFHRDTVGMVCTGIGTGGAGLSGGTAGSAGAGARGGIGGRGGGGGTADAAAGGSSYIDPRSRVVMSDCTIFGVDNPDRYPPDLETLVNGVNVVPRGGNATGAGVAGVNATEVGNSQLSTKKKVYLRAIPIDPITGKAEWDLRSCYDSRDADSWGGENVFDVRSKSKETALNGDKYSDW